MRIPPVWSVSVVLLACSDFNLQGLDKPDPGTDPEEDTAFDPEEEDLGACEPDEFPAEACPLDDACDFMKNPGEVSERRSARRWSQCRL